MRVSQVWTGPVECCDICQTILGGSHKEFVDGKMMVGSWALMCVPCHDDLGIGLGTGRGQKYRLENRGGDRAWFKIEG